MRNDVIRKVVWVLTLIYMALIFYMSARNVDESRVDSAKLMTVLGLVESENAASDVEDRQMMQLQTLVRKNAHKIIFAGLGMLYFVCVYGYWGKSLISGFIALVLSSLYGVTDEIHQIFSKRGAAVTDVLYDAAGALSGILILCVVFWIIEHNKVLKRFFSMIYDFEPVGSKFLKRKNRH